MRPMVLMVGHGSRDAPANDEFMELVGRYQARRPELEVRHGYVELAEPALADALAAIPSGCQEVTLLPVFLFAAGHVKRDIPRALADIGRRRPEVRFAAAGAIGVHRAMAELAVERAAEVADLSAAAAARTAVIVVGRGASDADANGDFCKLTRLIGETKPFSWVIPSFMGVTRPRFEETLEFVACSRPERILVIPYLLFAGRLLNQLRDQVAAFGARQATIEMALAPQLGVHERLLTVLDERLAVVYLPRVRSTGD